MFTGTFHVFTTAYEFLHVHDTRAVSWLWKGFSTRWTANCIERWHSPKVYDINIAFYFKYIRQASSHFCLTLVSWSCISLLLNSYTKSCFSKVSSSVCSYPGPVLLSNSGFLRKSTRTPRIVSDSEIQDTKDAVIQDLERKLRFKEERVSNGQQVSVCGCGSL